MNLRHITAAAALFAFAVAAAAEPVDLEMVGRIRNEGFRNSKVMDTASKLTDRYGPRLTGSPEIREASEWAVRQLTEWGLEGARLEPWSPFGRGWSWERASLRMTAPASAQLYAIPKAWSRGTDGPQRGKAMAVKLATSEDLEKLRGKLSGAILLAGDTPEPRPGDQPALRRHDEASLREVERYRIPTGRQWGGGREEWLKRIEFRRELATFLETEGVVAVVEAGAQPEGTNFDVGSTGAHRSGEPPGVASLVVPAEQFARLQRLLAMKEEVELEVDVRATIDEGQNEQWNVVAEIPGSDRRNEVVMLGGHIDSWHAGTGATDNAAGVAVMMEAVRILKALGVRPRRTIRIALWSGEEQGLLGSAAYVGRHFADWSEPSDPTESLLPQSLRKEKSTFTPRPDHARLSAYFNLDNGTGKIRGIYAQENFAAVPIFRAWLEPLHDLGATTVTTRETSGTDHLSFDRAGLPGFQFIQDDVEYSTRTHHSNTDVYERLGRDDLMQASVVVATFVYHAAMRDRMMPRKPLPPEARR
jgi:carboxypeptidase Q